MASPSTPTSTDNPSTAGGLTPEAAAAALAFQERQFTAGPISADPFYTAPPNSTSAAPGTLLKLEARTDPALYTLPPGTALSRLVFQSATLSGAPVPVSAYILWPFAPRANSPAQGGGDQVVAWAHGTSGQAPDCAPSHLRNLWQHLLAPFPLALQGYVVVAPDYAGLGVARDAAGAAVAHEYMSFPAQANDVLFAVQAARAAFPRLGKRFVVAGHSQGGGAAWACARRQARSPVEGYLGAVALSPGSDLRDEKEWVQKILVALMLPSIVAARPELQLGDVLTEDGMERLKKVWEAGASWAVGSKTLMETTKPLLREGWEEHEVLSAWLEEVGNTGKRIAGPMLAAHGSADPLLDVDVAEKAFRRTVEAQPEASIEFVRLEGLTHNAATTGAQRVYMDWIADRFTGKEPEKGLKSSTLEAAMPIDGYQAELNWWMARAENFYETP